MLAIPLSTQPLMFLCRPDHALAARAQVTLASLAEHDFVGPPKGSTGYEALDRVLAGAGSERRVRFEAVDVLTVVDFVAHGLGFTLLPQYVATSRPDLRAIPLAGPRMTWTLAAVMGRHQATPAGRAFAALLPQPGPPRQTPPRPAVGGPAQPGTAQDRRSGPQTHNARLRALAKPPNPILRPRIGGSGAR